MLASLTAMAEPLKTQFGPDVPRRIAAMIESVYPPFPSPAFLSDVLDGYERLELTPRARHIAKGLRCSLPQHDE